MPDIKTTSPNTPGETSHGAKRCDSRYRYRSERWEWTPFFLSVWWTDAVTGCKPEVTVTVLLHHIWILVVHQWKVVTNGMFYWIHNFPYDGCYGWQLRWWKLASQMDSSSSTHINVINIVPFIRYNYYNRPLYMGFTHTCIHNPVYIHTPFRHIGY